MARDAAYTASPAGQTANRSNMISLKRMLHADQNTKSKR
jgi:hypothetical protein